MGQLDSLSFLTAEGRTIPVEVKRRKGSRNLRLSFGHQNQLVASVPWNCGHKDLKRFIEKHRDWVESQLESIPAVLNVSEWFAKSPMLSGSGDCFTVRVETTARARADYTFDKDGADIILRLPATAEDREAVLRQLVRRFAKDAMTCRLAYHAKRLGLKFGKLSVRDQAGRWGSCASSGDISLNWRLVLLAPELQDYVILHELAHLTEMNHSKRFWTLLESYDPNRELHEQELDRLTPEIMRVGRS